ncbi:MAG: UDP-N-acetylglucosamine 2-epimerase (non-hydrolyzing), partial [Victivallaceae bacterium]|nr:UDP-N-acetylglucosamine 2-epimerase (non-hydrolyzing) [Victivallaceae bacterium]
MSKNAAKKLLITYGTRPEAIKLALLIKQLSRNPAFEIKTCSTGQHLEMLNQVTEFFSVKSDFNLNIMQKNQTLSSLTVNILARMEDVFAQWRPDLLIVQGDTSTVFAAALAAFYHKIDVAHVEAGLRTGNPYSPWPEEINRILVTRLAKFHFAPTSQVREKLIQEGVPEQNIAVTGNTVIDALLYSLDKLQNSPELQNKMRSKFSFLDRRRHLILFTGHRRENFGTGLLSIYRAIARLAGRPDVQIVYPVHLNPNVRQAAEAELSNIKNVHLI